MNITAAWAVLKADIKDPSAKHVALVVACHANRSEASARLSVQEIATDMGASYNTARRALDRAVGAGVLAVENPGEMPTAIRTWRLTAPPKSDVAPPPNIGGALPPNWSNPPPKSRELKRRTREEQERTAADNGQKAPSSERQRDVDKAPPDVAPAPPRSQTYAERIAEEARRQAERDAAVLALIDDTERARLNGAAREALAKLSPTEEPET